MSVSILELDDVLKEWGDRLIQRIRGNMAEQGVNASGGTSDSLECVLTEGGIQILGAEYFAERTEVGRTPTKNHESFDFVGIIRQWIEDKGIEAELGIRDDRDLDRRASAIVYTITHRGSLKYREKGRQTDVYSTDIGEAVEELGNELLIRSGERLMGVLDDISRQDGEKTGTAMM